jgi:choline dehydrogenase-like flavoprotein
MQNDHYDLIVIGSGPGGASLAQRLAPTGKRILILERGDYLPRSEKNWDSKTVFVDGAYQADETWTNKKGDTFKPALHYYVGGNSKVYGAALFRLRERDFGEVEHAGGVSPAWPLGYEAFEPFYTFTARGARIRWSRRRAPPIPIRRSATNRRCRASATVSPASG